jgi:DNA-3-methyladenine glycosylase II
VLFHAPDEAAAWSIISTRRPALQGAEIRRRLSEEHGARFDVAGCAMAAFPLPRQLAGLESFPGLHERKVAQLRGVAEAALAGVLDPLRLTALDPDEAMAQMRTLNGIGPFYASLIVVRASGTADVALQEPRAMASAARSYGLDAVPDSATGTALSDRWRPFRTWAMVLLRLASERASGGDPRGSGAADASERQH